MPLPRVFQAGVLSNVLNPKPGLFVLAFLPQFVSEARGSVHAQMLVYGVIFAVLTALVFTLLGGFSSRLSRRLAERPRVLQATNVGAGLTFIAAGLSILALDRRR
jgi:threonine/homoserine/homoserine lactone efflux protein